MSYKRRLRDSSSRRISSRGRPTRYWKKGRNYEFRALRKEKNEFKRKFLLAGYITKRLGEQGVKVYVVGGEAVELYTVGKARTGDIDIIATDKEKLIALLKELGFKQEGMIWLNTNLGIAIHVVGDSYSGDTDRVKKLRIGEYIVTVPSVEELIINRLVAAKFWKGNTQAELEQAAMLLASEKYGTPRIDREYLKRLAEREHVGDMLALIYGRMGES